MMKATMYYPVQPKRVFEALMDEKIHGEIIGAKATIEPSVGGSFSVWDGYATGKTIELVDGKKIVQTWRASDWPKGITSRVTFEFLSKKNGTKLVFRHENVPVEFEKDIKDGWRQFYWEPMKRYFQRA